ncbi:hypothetical protein K0U00_48405, partial [Paenibacillus sepulcri]|nr:hypothetical protein [Paenibacillus sepulcri]
IQSLLDSRQMGGMAVRKQEHEWLLIIEYREGVNNEPFWQDMSSAIRGAMDWTATIGICDTAALLNQGYRMFKEAEKAVGERFYRGYGGIIRAGQVQSGLDADMDIEDEPSLQKMNLADGEPLREDIGQYFDRMARVRLSKNGV